MKWVGERMKGRIWREGHLFIPFFPGLAAKALKGVLKLRGDW